MHRNGARRCFAAFLSRMQFAGRRRGICTVERAGNRTAYLRNRHRRAGYKPSGHCRRDRLRYLYAGLHTCSDAGTDAYADTDPHAGADGNPVFLLCADRQHVV